jgi:hypothetical protein
MRALSLILAAAILTASPAWAKPKGCFTKREEIAEQVVRHGVRLREGAQRCQELGFSTETGARWRAMDDLLGEQFSTQVGVRAKAFGREFGEAAEGELRLWDGRIVSYFRHRPLSEIYCRALDEMMDEASARGFNGFKAQALRERGEVRIQYRICD